MISHSALPKPRVSACKFFHWVCIGRLLYMMMIAFITINGGLVPLIEGLCAQILYFSLRFEIIGSLRSLHILVLLCVCTLVPSWSW